MDEMLEDEVVDAWKVGVEVAEVHKDDDLAAKGVQQAGERVTVAPMLATQAKVKGEAVKEVVTEHTGGNQTRVVPAPPVQSSITAQDVEQIEAALGTWLDTE
eukprot:5613295-Amphidinium_carterae.1